MINAPLTSEFQPTMAIGRLLPIDRPTFSMFTNEIQTARAKLRDIAPITGDGRDYSLRFLHSLAGGEDAAKNTIKRKVTTAFLDESAGRELPYRLAAVDLWFEAMSSDSDAMSDAMVEGVTNMNDLIRRNRFGGDSELIGYQIARNLVKLADEGKISFPALLQKPFFKGAIEDVLEDALIVRQNIDHMAEVQASGTTEDQQDRTWNLWVAAASHRLGKEIPGGGSVQTGGQRDHLGKYLDSGNENYSDTVSLLELAQMAAFTSSFTLESGGLRINEGDHETLSSVILDGVASSLQKHPDYHFLSAANGRPSRDGEQMVDTLSLLAAYGTEKVSSRAVGMIRGFGRVETEPEVFAEFYKYPDNAARLSKEGGETLQRHAVYALLHLADSPSLYGQQASEKALRAIGYLATQTGNASYFEGIIRTVAEIASQKDINQSLIDKGIGVAVNTRVALGKGIDADTIEKLKKHVIDKLGSGETNTFAKRLIQAIS